MPLSRLVVAALLASIGPHLRAQTPPPETGTQQLDAVNANAQRYQPVPLPFPSYLGFLQRPQMPFGPLPRLGFNASVMDELVVTATRVPQSADQVTTGVRLLTGNDVRQAPTLTLDAALRSVPGFSLFRRSDSLIANPTAQGVSLRGLGPSGASRSLVLLDGVPLNDPFGGWVAWSKVPREGLGRAEILPGGGATAWGNAALGGVLHLLSAPPSTQLAVVDHPPAPVSWASTGSLRFTTLAGDYGTRSAELALVVPTAKGAVQLLGRTFRTEGFVLVAPERRGPIDLPAWSRHRWLTARWRHELGPNLELLATARVFEEKRGNGTPYQRNGSREKFASLALAGDPAPAFSWHAIAYAQTQGFASTFSSVTASRSAETPASDQFAVPSTALGATWTGVWYHGVNARTNLGADTRLVRGETREHFLFSNGAFTRLRVAGGKQLVGGVFALHERALTENLRASLGGRVDRWQDSDGHRWEIDRNTRTVLRDERYGDRGGTTFSPSAGLLWTPSRPWRVRGSAQQAYRRPTLNELHRPFRVGPNVTEANAALGSERVTSGELAVEWSSAPRKPRPGAKQAGSTAALTLGATAFANDLRDAVGNVTLVRGPGAYPMFGFIGAGGVGRQRLNLERIRVRGVELSARWSATDSLTLTGDYLLNDATVRRAALAPGLAGKRVAQVPRRTGSLAAIWHAPAQLTFTPRVRWIGRQFEDDENQLVLGEVVVADLSVSRQLTKNLQVFLTIENLGDARVETGRTADGLVNVGTPRLAAIGLRGSW